MAPQSFDAFTDPVQDKLLGLIMALGAEVWVVKDRLALLEEALNERDIPAAELIEDRAHRPERVEAVERERDAFMERFLRLLTLKVKG